MASAPQLEPVTINGKQYRPVQEGLASILAPYREAVPQPSKQNPGKQVKNNDEGNQAVFYNPIQQFNRDLSVLAILTYGEGAIVGKEARYAKRQKFVQTRKEKSKKKSASSKDSNEESIAADDHDVAPSSPRKRKADSLDEEVSANEVKKAKVDEFEADEEELEIMQLDTNHNDKNRSESDVNPADGEASEKADTSVEHTKVKQRRVPFSILDALSATGLRALRYAKEIPFATTVVANDLLPDAVKAIQLNVEHNDLRNIVHANVGDARAYMYSKIGSGQQQSAEENVSRFDVIDLDPYGTAAPFIDSAVQAVQDGGLLCITCTDAGVFASNGYPEKAYALYGGVPVKGAHSHEAGLRLILNAVGKTASKYGIAIEPLLSLSIDFYARLFIRLHKQQKDVKLFAGTSMITYTCDHGCGAWTTQPIARNQVKPDKAGNPYFKYGFAQAPTTSQSCQHCGSRMHLGGPMWAGPLHNPYFVQRILDKLPSLDTKVYATTDRLRGMLTLALEEDITLATSNDAATIPAATTDSEQPAPDPRIIPRLPADAIDSTPFFFIPNYIAKVIHCTTPPEDPLRGAIRHLGYRVTRSHCKPGSFKTNAPWTVIWEIMREWVRIRSPTREGAVKENTSGWQIMLKARNTETRIISDLKDDMKAKMDKCENTEDLKTLIRSVMWRLEHEKTPDATSPAVFEGELKSGKQLTNGNHNIDNQEQPSGSNAVTAADLSTGSKPVSELNIIFDDKLGKEKPRDKLVRYQINPRANWGPMNRAGGGS